jgi:hypothetical protein
MKQISPTALTIIVAFAVLSPAHRTDVLAVACPCEPSDRACYITNCSGIGSGPGTGNVGTDSKKPPELSIESKKPIEQPKPDTPPAPRSEQR